MIALMVAAALAGQGQDWPYEPPQGWYRTAYDDGLVAFVQPHRTNPRMYWTWYEYRPGNAEGYGSGRSLSEFNCQTWRLRNISSETWTGSGMSGEKIENRTDPGNWAYQAPGTFGEAALEHFCG